MKFTKPVKRWTIAGALALVIWYLLANTTILYGYTMSDGTTLTPSAAAGWCQVGQRLLGSKPPGCGAQDGPLAVAYLMLLAALVCAVVAAVKARKAAKGIQTVPTSLV
jgi:hypothetical protein